MWWKYCSEWIINDEIESINFKNAIIQSINIELPEFGKDIKEMRIEEGYGNDYYIW